MKIEGNLKIVITRLEEQTDYEENLFFKCKGYSPAKAISKNGKNVKTYNQFTTIRLYPCNQMQYEATKKRLFEQKVEKPVLNIVSYDTEIATPLIQGKIYPILTANRYDFAKHKLFSKKELLKLGEIKDGKNT